MTTDLPPMSEIAEAKAVLEAALLVAGEPVPPAQLAKLFEPALAARHRARAARRARARLVVAQGRARAGRVGLAIPGPARSAALPRSSHTGKTAALFARGDGNAGDHRLSATRHPRRHRSRSAASPCRRTSSRRSKTGNGSRPSAIAKRRDVRRSTRRRRPSSTISASPPSRNCRLSPNSIHPTYWRCLMPPPRPPRRHTHSRARSSGPIQQPSLALQRIAESLPPPKHKRSTDEVFSEPQRLHKVLASCGFGSRRAMEEMILAGRITVNRMPADVGQKVSPGDEVRINGELVKVRFAEPRAARADVSQAVRRARHARRSGRSADGVREAAVDRQRQVDQRRTPRLQHRGPAAVHQLGRARQPADASALRGRARICGAHHGPPHRRAGAGADDGRGARRRPGALREGRPTAAATRTARTIGTTSC